MMADEDLIRPVKQFAYRKLALRSYHSAELEQLLIKQGFSPELIQQVLTELTSSGYLNDEEWTRSYIERHSSRYGPRAIKQRLRMKGIEEEVASKDQVSAIQHLLETKYRSKERNKTISSLLRRGFDLDSIFEALK